MGLAVFFGILVLFSAKVFANPVLPSDKFSQDLVDFSADPLANCPTGYTQPANSNWPTCYKVYGDLKSRDDAGSQCKLDNGTLTSVPNAFVNSYLNLLATQSKATSIWLGIECLNGDRSRCFNDDLTNAVYNNFRPGQPDPFDNCIYMSASGRESQLWSSFPCDQRFAFACEVPIGSAEQPSTTGKTLTTTYTPPAYHGCPQRYDNFSGTCYQVVSFLPYKISADAASSACQKIIGGSLATVQNAQINQFLASKEPSTNSYVAFGLRCPLISAMGDTSSCKWYDGTVFQWSGFYTDHPNPALGSPCCDFNRGNW